MDALTNCSCTADGRTITGDDVSVVLSCASCGGWAVVITDLIDGQDQGMICRLGCGYKWSADDPDGSRNTARRRQAPRSCRIYSITGEPSQ
jgi:hypothetical protein